MLELVPFCSQFTANLGFQSVCPLAWSHHFYSGRVLSNKKYPFRLGCELFEHPVRCYDVYHEGKLEIPIELNEYCKGFVKVRLSKVKKVYPNISFQNLRVN